MLGLVTWPLCRPILLFQNRNSNLSYTCWEFNNHQVWRLCCFLKTRGQMISVMISSSMLIRLPCRIFSGLVRCSPHSSTYFYSMDTVVASDLYYQLLSICQIFYYLSCQSASFLSHSIYPHVSTWAVLSCRAYFWVHRVFDTVRLHDKNLWWLT
jgi:hypothetical protein